VAEEQKTNLNHPTQLASRPIQGDHKHSRDDGMIS